MECVWVSRRVQGAKTGCCCEGRKEHSWRLVLAPRARSPRAASRRSPRRRDARFGTGHSSRCNGGRPLTDSVGRRNWNPLPLWPRAGAMVPALLYAVRLAKYVEMRLAGVSAVSSRRSRPGRARARACECHTLTGTAEPRPYSHLKDHDPAADIAAHRARSRPVGVVRPPSCCPGTGAFPASAVGERVSTVTHAEGDEFDDCPHCGGGWGRPQPVAGQGHWVVVRCTRCETTKLTGSGGIEPLPPPGSVA